MCADRQRVRIIRCKENALFLHANAIVDISAGIITEKDNVPHRCRASEVDNAIRSETCKTELNRQSFKDAGKQQTPWNL